MMPLATESHVAQRARWPREGEHIMAHYDETSIVVYQAWRPSTGHHAIRHGKLGGPDFSFNRMSWIKPNFLWMMYRSGWGTMPGQEVVLGLRIRRSFFDALLAQAVPSGFQPGGEQSHEAWQQAVATSSVRQQWDPDHAPSGARLQRRAIQLGLRGEVLRAYAEPELLEVIDMSGFVAEQRAHASDDNPLLHIPVERPYLPLTQGNTP